MVRKTGPRQRGKEVVRQHIVLRVAPVAGNVGLRVLAIASITGCPATQTLVEVIHCPVIDGTFGVGKCVGYIRCAILCMSQRDNLSARNLSARCTVRTRVASENIVECSVFFDDDYDMPNWRDLRSAQTAQQNDRKNNPWHRVLPHFSV